MGKKKVAEAIEKVVGKDIGPYKSVRIASIAPNDWNPNKMDATTRDKLAKGIKRVMDAVGHIPPIIIRRHPDKSVAKYQIIDGYHRWDILRTEGFERIDAYIIDVDTKTAMILTDTLNYLRGEPSPDDYAAYFKRLIVEEGVPVAEAAEFLPESQDEIISIMEAYDIEIPKIDVEIDYDGDGREKDEEDAFIELKVNVSRSQAEVIERELSRVGALLNGKNIRGRALEFMAVNSSQTPIDNLMGEGTVDLPKPSKEKKLDKLKKKMKEKAS